MDHVTAEHVSTDTYADRTPDSYQLNDQTTQAKQELMAQRWPHLSMVGDFHTHPYRTYGQAVKDKGWHFSPADYNSYEGWDSSEGWSGRVAVVLTIAEVRPSAAHADPSLVSKDSHILYWQLGGYRFWLSAYAIDRSAGRLVVSPPVSRDPIRENVYIDVPTINGTDAWFSYE